VSVAVKICGLSTAEAVTAAVEGGAAMVGFVFFPPSPRSLEPERAAELAALVPDHVTKVALTVDADDALFDAVVAHLDPGILQLHGKEGPARMMVLRQRYGREIMKAVAISGPGDVVRARRYEDSADRLLFDAKPPKGATRPGGNALVFDWAVLAGETWSKPWMLAGGIHAGNLAEAVEVSGAAMVDVSSGVEDTPGVKNTGKIREFLALAASL